MPLNIIIIITYDSKKEPLKWNKRWLAIVYKHGLSLSRSRRFHCTLTTSVNRRKSQCNCKLSDVDVNDISFNWNTWVYSKVRYFLLECRGVINSICLRVRIGFLNESVVGEGKYVDERLAYADSHYGGDEETKLLQFDRLISNIPVMSLFGQSRKIDMYTKWHKKPALRLGENY